MPDSVGIGPHNKFEDVGTLVVFAGVESKEASCMRLGGEVDLQSMLIYMYIYIYIIYIYNICVYIMYVCMYVM